MAAALLARLAEIKFTQFGKVGKAHIVRRRLHLRDDFIKTRHSSMVSLMTPFVNSFLRERLLVYVGIFLDMKK
jgi:hypothetical protein